MEESNRVHHGHNVELALKWKKVKQTDLADRINRSQSYISKSILSKEIIEDTELEQIAKALDVPFDFLKSFEPDSIFTSVNFHIDNGDGNYNKSETKVINPLEKVSELYEQIAELKVENNQLKNDIEKLKK